MKRLTIIVSLLLAVQVAFCQNVDFDRWFTGGTLRIDCLREGSAMKDTVWVARWTDRGSQWHGSRTQLIDPFDNGDYRIVVRDIESGLELYSRGYSNLFREYKDTPEGRTVSKRFEETLLVPMPRRAVLIALQRRDKEMRLVDQTVVRFDPGMARPARHHGMNVRQIPFEIHGRPTEKLDVAIVLQGFEGASRVELEAVQKRMTEVLFGKEPFKRHRDDFNVWFVMGNAGVEYNTFGADRYAMTFRVWQLHDLLGQTPADHVIIVINNETYGGGAIYNFYSVSSLHSMAESVLPHELGHGIGGLADEYVDEDLSYADLHRTRYEPLEPNITNLVNFKSKWQHLLPKSTKVPTPDADVPRGECGPLGVYEGAGYSAKGVYRPAMHCMMRDYAPFCPVCSERLGAVIKLYVR